MARGHRSTATAVVVGAVAVLASVCAAPGALAATPGCGTRSEVTHAELAECITLADVRQHVAALQEVADRNHGTRVSGAPGHRASVDYVVERLTAAGYRPEVQPFTFDTFVTLSPAVLEQVGPQPRGPLATAMLDRSGSGDVTAPVTTVPARPGDPTPGCEPTDFAGFPAGHVALVARGSCTFADKATNAHDAGAVAVVIRDTAPGILNGTLGDAFDRDIPLTSVTREDGDELGSTSGLVLRVRTDTFRGTATSHNVVAETRTGNDGNVVMAGAHLDSVNAGPGINDNGSGAAALLEVAEQLAAVAPRNTVRFAWWGAEEAGLVGSSRYVSGLGQAERDDIALYLNVDMVASPNHVYFVHDGDDSDRVGAGPGPLGSDRIERTFQAFYSRRGVPTKGVDLSGRSDYAPFITAGIPSGGLFTGADGTKTAEEAALWGGTAGERYDPCYHQGCDTLANTGDAALDLNSDALGFAVLQYAMNTEDVNGIDGDPRFPPVDPVGPATS